jgi:transposase
MPITTLGIDLAKHVFQLHGVDARGHVVLSRRVKRSQLVETVASLPPCVIGMEACGSAHHWGRVFEQLGHTVKLMSPQYVKPYVKTNKNDARDAEAICEAVSRPTMRCVSIKTVEQADLQAVHRTRSLTPCQTPDRRHQSNSGPVGRVWVGDGAIPREGPTCPRPISGASSG